MKLKRLFSRKKKMIDIIISRFDSIYLWGFLLIIVVFLSCSSVKDKKCCVEMVLHVSRNCVKEKVGNSEKMVFDNDVRRIYMLNDTTFFVNSYVDIYLEGYGKRAYYSVKISFLKHKEFKCDEVVLFSD